MQYNLQLVVSPKEAAIPNILKTIVSRKLSIPESDISDILILRKSIDARSQSPKVNLSLNVFCGEKPELAKAEFNYHHVGNKPEVLIVGSGPAGLFAALRLIELDFKPIILERGKDVSERKRNIATMIRDKKINTESNYCYGEGGAGTFSDGKLYTRSNKRGNTPNVLKRFHFHEAQDEILFEAHPHIGSDILPEVIKDMRNTIINCGGDIYFDSKVNEFILSNGKIEGVKCANGNSYKALALILATGHSARDIYALLQKQNILIEAKNFAVGVRVEHPQSLIDTIQYHSKVRDQYLPAATYSLVAQVAERGVYSFCMCPGGFIVPAATAQNEIVVNGMSASGRNTAYANSGIVVETRVEDLQDYAKYDELCGLQYQAELEQMAFENGGGGQIAPAQRLTDFVDAKLSSSLPSCSYMPGLSSSPLHSWLPKQIANRLQEGFKVFGKKKHGYLTQDALIVGVESRSSSPIRIPRNDKMQHITIENLYPCGEGAGYAGGITSSAIDGERCAEMLAEAFKDKI